MNLEDISEKKWSSQEHVANEARVYVTWSMSEWDNNKHVNALVKHRFITA